MDQLVKLFFEGVEMHVPAGSVAEVMRQLRQLKTPVSTLTQSVPAPAVFPFPSAAPTPSLTAAPAPTINPQTAWPFPTGQGSGFYDSAGSLRFLRAIEANSWGGEPLNGDKLTQLLGLVHSKGIGSKAAMLNKHLVALGFNPEEVYSNPRDGTGMRHWIPGPKLNAAIKAILGESKNQR